CARAAVAQRLIERGAGRKKGSNSARGSANAAVLHSVPAAATANAVRLTASVSLIITSPCDLPNGRRGGQNGSNLPSSYRPRARPPRQRDHVVDPTLRLVDRPR